MYFTVETMRLGGDWPWLTNFVLEDNLIILSYTNPGYLWLLKEIRTKQQFYVIFIALLPRTLFSFLSFSICSLFQ